MVKFKISKLIKVLLVGFLLLQHIYLQELLTICFNYQTDPSPMLGAQMPTVDAKQRCKCSVPSHFEV